MEAFPITIIFSLCRARGDELYGSDGGEGRDDCSARQIGCLQRRSGSPEDTHRGNKHGGFGQSVGEGSRTGRGRLEFKGKFRYRHKNN